MRQTGNGNNSSVLVWRANYLKLSNKNSFNIHVPEQQVHATNMLCAAFQSLGAITIIGMLSFARYILRQNYH